MAAKTKNLFFQEPEGRMRRSEIRNEDDVKGLFGFSSNKIVYNVYALKVKNKSSKKKK